MRLAVTFLGLDLFSVDLSTEPDQPEDCSRDLSGGTLSYDRIEVASTDRYMGFTNGREVGDDD